MPLALRDLIFTVQFSLWDHREPGMPELVVFLPHPLSFSFFLILFQSFIYFVYLKHHLALSFFLALLFHILGTNTDDTCMCLFYCDILI